MRSYMRKQMIPFFMLLGMVVAFGTSRAQAQIIDPIEVDVPFQFHAGDAKLPAGKYMVKMLDETNLMVMEISSVDGHHAAVFQVRYTKADTTPKKTELIFNRYGDQYFLSQVFDEGNKSGSELLESRYEMMAKKGGLKAEKHHVPAHHRNHAKG